MIRIGTRGSQLALWQADHVASLLRGQGCVVEVEIIRTTGDRLQEVAFAQVGTKGMFTLEIEEALAAGRIDLAVHSLKDLPTELPAEFTLAAIPTRADARDVLVSRDFGGFKTLPAGAKVGTSSLRRQAQLRHVRDDLEFVEFRGNVDTRLRKLGEGQAAAILLAAAGLDRLEKTEWIRERIDPETLCPAPGQGALAIESRAADARVLEAVAFLDDATTRFAVTAERTALAALGGGCQVPVGAYCRPLQIAANETECGRFAMLAAVSDAAGKRLVRARCEGDDAEQLGNAVAAELLRQGAAELLEGSGAL